MSFVPLSQAVPFPLEGKKKRVYKTHVSNVVKKKKVSDSKSFDESSKITCKETPLQIRDPKSLEKSKRGRPSKKNNLMPPPSLMSFMSSKSVPSAIVSNASTSGAIKSSIPVECKNGFTYILVFGVNNDVNSILPIVLMVQKISIPTDCPKEDMIVRFRVDHVPYTGRIMMMSGNRVQIENGIPQAIDLVKDMPGSFVLKKDHVIYSCTSCTCLQKADPQDKRTNFIRMMLKAQNRETNDNVPLESSFNNVKTSSVMQTFQSTNTTIVDPEILVDEQYMDQGHDSESDNVSHDINDLLNSTQNNIEKSDDSAIGHEVVVSSDDELQSKLEKKTRVRQFTEEKMVAKAQIDKDHALERINSDIVYSIEKLAETIPTLPKENQASPIMTNLFAFMKLINAKVNLLVDRPKIPLLPLSRDINITKGPGPDEINIENRLTMPMTEYCKAIEAESPCLVISRLIRSCVSRDLKIGCKLNEQADDSNFIYRIGNADLHGTERLNDGQETLDMLIELAHSLKGEHGMSTRSYSACIYQVKKGLYDFNRRNVESCNQPADVSSKMSNLKAHETSHGSSDLVSFI